MAQEARTARRGKENKKMTKYKKLMPAVMALAIFASTAGGSYAYLTHSVGTLTNKFTPGSIDVDLKEDQWKPEEGKNLNPREVVAKDPTVENTGDNEEWVFLRVDVPVKNIHVVDSTTHRKQAAADTELFSFTADTGWEQISKEVSDGYAHYVYGYKTVVKPGEKTSALFDEVKMVNYLEGDIDKDEELKIPIETVAIQSNVEGSDEGLAKIYQQYLAQEAADNATT